jgi:hypothetical protein
MRRSFGLAAVAALGAVAAGCLSGASHQGTLSATDALAQAREDGFVKARRLAQPPSWLCGRRYTSLGPTAPSGKFAEYVRPNYVINFTDKRVPEGPDNSPRIVMTAVVFPNESTAQRCAEGAIYQERHIPVEQFDAQGGGPFKPYKLIDPTTVETFMHAPGAPGFDNSVDDGTYQTWIAHGRVFALGLAYNEPHSQIVREDLERLAAEIAG